VGNCLSDSPLFALVQIQNSRANFTCDVHEVGRNAEGAACAVLEIMVLSLGVLATR
jgi:hypothetical protein